MATLAELKKIRLEKLKKIKRNLINPYPQKVKRTHTISEALKNFSKLEKSKKEVFLVGRIRTMRFHGKLTFLDFEDSTGKIQALLRENKMGEKAYQFFQENIDIGDFVQFRGNLMKTKTGEKTLEVSDFKILAKSLRPLPEKWHGLKEVEERYRKRYLDLIFNPEVKEKFVLRSKIVSEIRRFLENEGFLEVETPILQPIYGGASAKPFKTHLEALNLDLYLRIAPELYLKRLLVGGFERVFEIGRVFRNEGVDRFHNPDFTSLELYLAYADYKELMKLIERMLCSILKKIFGKLKIQYQGRKINFEIPFKREEYFHLLKRETKLDLEILNLESLKKEAKKLGIDVLKAEGKAEIYDKIYKKFCLPKIFQPTFILHHPKEKCPLAKTLEKDPKKLASFQLVAGNWEIGWGYSELNDPIEQKRGFKEQEKKFIEGLKEAQRMDEDFVEALEYGMPPAAGFGMGIDRLTALLTNSYCLREVILFPTMRPK